MWEWGISMLGVWTGTIATQLCSCAGDCCRFSCSVYVC